MLIFFFIAISYCSANIYFFYKVTSVSDSGTAVDVLTGIVVFILTLLPVFIPIYSHKASERSLKIISYTGYLWLAFLIPFFPVALILDLYNMVALSNAYLMGHSHALFIFSTGSTFFIPLSLSAVIVAYGYFEARNLRVERLLIHTSKLPPGAGNIRIAQISDLHLSVTVGEHLIDRIIKITEEEKPDIIVSTGDLIDGLVKHISHLSGRLRRLNARYGKFAVIGNHEFYGGLRHTVKFIEESGFTVLRDSGVTIENIINIAGMDFTGGETRGYSNDAPRQDEREMLSKLQPGLFTLLLKHRSDVKEESLGLFDLQLSGHSHKGQIFPVNLATMFLFQYHTGFTKLPKGSAIHTSRGTGTAGPPVRFLSTPEITIIDIVKAASS
ncbi:MAG: metallophosphoesterase [Nitrospirae bacterium]|nr:metallophosphoesterase [Nitrospirota bacterium]